MIIFPESDSEPDCVATDTLLTIAVGSPLPTSSARHDAWITGREGRAELAALFTQWLPPAPETLERLAGVFGREVVAELAVSLRDELRHALEGLSVGAMPDGHKLSGLAGTLGFAAASAAWRDADEGGGTQDARRTSRTAIVAITHWLRAAG